MLLHVTMALVLAEALSPQRASGRATPPRDDEGRGVTVDPGRLPPEEQPSMCWLCGPHCWIRCSWSVYYPRFVNHSAHVEVVSTQFGASQPALNIGPDDTLIVQGDGLFVSVTGGRNWTKCDPDAYYSWRCGAHASAAALSRRLGARTRSGTRSGVGWLSDGSILVTGSPGTFPSKQIVFRGTALPNGSLAWSPGFTLQPRPSPVARGVGGDGSNRFFESPTVSDTLLCNHRWRTFPREFVAQTAWPHSCETSRAPSGHDILSRG